MRKRGIEGGMERRENGRTDGREGKQGFRNGWRGERRMKEAGNGGSREREEWRERGMNCGMERRREGWVVGRERKGE